MNRKRVLVTGASRGIGAAIAVTLVKNGYTVYGTSRNPEIIERPINQVQYLLLDLNDISSIRACVDKISDVDILVNNAGISHMAPAEEYPLARTEALFRTNLYGAIELIHAYLPGMRERGYGYVLNVGSMAGRFAVPFQSSYVASKFALAGYTWALRNEVMPYGIRVVTVEPNDIRTDIAPDVLLRDNSAYEGYLNRVKRIRDANMDKAESPQVVAEMVLKILRTNNPRPFYTVGGRGPMMVFLKRFLPDRVVETMVRKNYDLPY